MVAMGPDPNCVQLVHLSRISHKYQFRSIETWALEALNNYFVSHPSAFDSLPPSLPAPGNAPADPPAPSLVQVTELAALCERMDLLSLAVNRWKHLIAQGKDLSLAINLGERFNLKPITGLAYYHMMLKGRSHWDTESTLSREQRGRLLSGYYSLGKLWDTLQSQPPLINHTARCASQQRCNKAWTGVWKAVVDVVTNVIPSIPKDDLLARCMLAEAMVKALMESQIPSQGFLDGIPSCRESALVATQMRVREIRDALADHFMDEF